MSIKRTTPEVGYLDGKLLADAGVSQTVRAGSIVHFSGIVAATGQGEAVAIGDMAGQLRFILQVLERLLQAEGLTFANVVSTTTYCRDIRQLVAHGDILAAAFREYAPTSTWVQVGALTSPDYLVELVVIASDG